MYAGLCYDRTVRLPDWIDVPCDGYITMYKYKNNAVIEDYFISYDENSEIDGYGAAIRNRAIRMHFDGDGDHQGVAVEVEDVYDVEFESYCKKLFGILPGDWVSLITMYDVRGNSRTYVCEDDMIMELSSSDD